jgi:predicted dehydrogenase
MGAPVDSRGDTAFKVTGTKGWIDVTSSAGTYRIVLRTNPAKKDGATKEDEQVFEIKGEGVKKEIEYFVEAVKGGKGLGIGEPRGALRDVAFIEAGLGSKGESVDLEKLVREGK